MGDLIQSVCVCVWGNVLRTVSYVVSLRYGQIICSYCGGTQLAQANNRAQVPVGVFMIRSFCSM
jgi:hypothetical protein